MLSILKSKRIEGGSFEEKGAKAKELADAKFMLFCSGKKGVFAKGGGEEIKGCLWNEKGLKQPAKKEKKKKNGGGKSLCRRAVQEGTRAPFDDSRKSHIIKKTEQNRIHSVIRGWGGLGHSFYSIRKRYDNF